MSCFVWCSPVRVRHLHHWKWGHAIWDIQEVPHLSLCTLSWAGTLTRSTSGVHVDYMIWLAFTSGHSFPFWGLSESHVSWNFHLLFSASIRSFCLWDLPQGYLSANGDFLFPLWLPCVLTGFLYEESHVLMSTYYSLRKGPHLASKEHSRKVTVFLPVLPHVGKSEGFCSTLSVDGTRQKVPGSTRAWPPKQTSPMMWTDLRDR